METNCGWAGSSSISISSKQEARAAALAWHEVIMAYQVLIHLSEQEPIVLDIDELPNPSDQYVIGRNPRARDGKDLHYVEQDVTTVLFPWWRIQLVEILPSLGEEEEIETFVRE
jgi:hypothetical protein